MDKNMGPSRGGGQVTNCVHIITQCDELQHRNCASSPLTKSDGQSVIGP